MTITVDSHFDTRAINSREISDLMSKYKSCKMFIIYGNRMRYAFDDAAELAAFQKDIDAKVTPAITHYKPKSLKAILSRFFRKLFT